MVRLRIFPLEVWLAGSHVGPLTNLESDHDLTVRDVLRIYGHNPRTVMAEDSEHVLEDQSLVRLCTRDRTLRNKQRGLCYSDDDCPQCAGRFNSRASRARRQIARQSAGAPPTPFEYHPEEFPALS